MAPAPPPPRLDLAYPDPPSPRLLPHPASVDPSWRAVFGNGRAAAVPVPVPVPEAVPEAVPVPVAVAAPLAARFGRVYGLVNAYRVRGHLVAQLDPLDSIGREALAEL